jgi:hypothetical protein
MLSKSSDLNTADDNTGVTESFFLQNATRELIFVFVFNFFFGYFNSLFFDRARSNHTE